MSGNEDAEFGRSDETGITFTVGETIAAALGKIGAVLRRRGFEAPEADARALVSGILGISKAHLIAAPDRVIADAAAPLAAAVQRRLRHEPVSRILGVKEFYGRNFHITSDVLDPRPDTETVVEMVLDIVDREGGRQRPLRIADIGTGSGAILLTLLGELPAAVGIGTDVSAEALGVAAGNARALGVVGRCQFLHTRGLGAAAANVDIVVSNPPYIEGSSIAGLEPSVRDFDPHVALDGGTCGLAIYKEIAHEIMALERPCWVVLELGAGQLDLVSELFMKYRTRDAASAMLTRNDLGGHTRAVAFKHQGAATQQFLLD